MKKTLFITAKVLIFVLVAWFVRGTFLSAYEQIKLHPLQIQPAWLLLSGVIYLIAMLPSGWYWHHILRVLGQEAGLGETLQAYYLGHLGKYVPGKAMVVILRTGLIRSHRVNTTLAVVSVFYETLTMMAVGAFLAVAILAFRLQEDQKFLWASVGFLCLVGLPTLPPFFRLMLRILSFIKFSKRNSPLPLAGTTQSSGSGVKADLSASPRPLAGTTQWSGPGVRADEFDNNNTIPTPNPKTQDPSPKTPISILEYSKRLSYSNVFIGWFAMLFVWVGMAASLWAVGRSCGLDFNSAEHFADYTAAVSLSVVLGFLAFIPGGLGVRDMILVVLLVRLLQIDEAPAAVAAGLLRLVWLVAELLVFSILYPLRIKLRQKQQNQTQP